jgi:predicted RNA-binding protein associated with RNAse of E/G family
MNFSTLCKIIKITDMVGVYAVIFDEEWKEALDAGEISKLDYDMTYETCDKIIKEVIPNKKF